MDFTVAFYVSITLLGALLLIGATKRPKDEKTFFDRVSSKEIQGFLAIFIMFHQTVVILEKTNLNLGEMTFFYFYGILAVAFFFFCSGFGLIKRWTTDQSYIKGFMRRRVFTVLVPFFICNYIYLTDALINNIRIGSHYGFGAVICSFFGIFLVNNQMWFAVEIMILYVVFRIVFAKVKKPLTGILIMTGVVLIMILAGLLSGHSESPDMSYWFMGEWWYNTLLMFPLGMLYAYKEERINRVLKKAFVSILIASSVIFLLMDQLHRYLVTEKTIYWTEYMGSDHQLLDKLFGLGQETVFEIIFLMIVITLMSLFKFSNPVLKFLGKISLEIIMLNYIMANRLLFLCEQYGIMVYLPAVALSTIAASSVVYIIKNIVLERRSGLFDGKVT
ncbi:MAG: acyltransferase [Saccharofermentans sp.]|nr:acyltransferase [Saccharofermentans sp.]